MLTRQKSKQLEYEELPVAKRVRHVKSPTPSTRKRGVYQELPVAKRVRHVEPPKPPIEFCSRFVKSDRETTELYPIRGFRTWQSTPWHGHKRWNHERLSRTFATRTSIISIGMVFREQKLTDAMVDVYRFRSASGRDGPAIHVKYHFMREWSTFASISIRPKRSKERLYMSKVLNDTARGLGFPIVKGFENLSLVSNSTFQGRLEEAWNARPLREKPPRPGDSSYKMRLRFKYFYWWRHKTVARNAIRSAALYMFPNVHEPALSRIIASYLL